MLWRRSESDAAILVETGGGIEFRRTLHEPGRIGRGVVLVEKMVGIFVEQDRLGAHILIGIADAARNEGHGATRSRDVEAHQASPHPSQAPNGVRIVDSIDRDPVSRAGIEVGQAMDRPHRPFETLETGSELSQRFFAVLRIDDEMTGLRLAPLRGGWAGPSQDRQKDRPKTHRSPLSRAKQEPLVSQPPSLAAGTRSTQLSWFSENRSEEH